MEIVVQVSLASIQLQGLDSFAAWCIPCYTLFYGFHKILNTEKKPESSSCGKFQSGKICCLPLPPQLQITVRRKTPN